MNGEIVPVKEVVSPGRGVHYEVYNSNYPDKEHYLVSWDGRRWVFERPTSVHVSSSLEKQITSDMFTHNIDVTHLSSPDKNGLRWDENNKSYLNVSNQFIRVKKVGNNRFLLIKAVQGPRFCRHKMKTQRIVYLTPKLWSKFTHNHTGMMRDLIKSKV